MKSVSYPYYLLCMLGVIDGYNGLSRTAWALLLQDIKTSLHLSDTQLGLLSGIAFALFYSVMGIPIARWADRGFRVSVISLTTALSGAMVALCGATQSFVQLMGVRVGVAIGEAGCTPPAHSLIAAHFSRAERARATSVFLFASYAVAVVGTALVGWSNEFQGWRATFVLIGLPGFALAVLAWLTLREPPPERDSVRGSEENPGLGEVLAILLSNRTFRYLLYAWVASTFLEAGIAQWSAAFFVRTHGIGTGELGTWFSAITMVSIVGMYVGGELASRYAPNNETLQLRIMAIVLAVYAALSVGVYLAPNLHLALMFKAICALGAAATVGPMFAIIQTLVSPSMRAVSIAVILLISNLVGMGIAPLAVGLLSDALTPVLGDQSLRSALVAASPGYLLAAYYVWQAQRSVAQDLAQVLTARPEREGAGETART